MLVFTRTSACCKPETQQVGFGDTNPYRDSIHMNKSIIYSSQYELIYHIGIKWVNYIALDVAHVPWLLSRCTAQGCHADTSMKRFNSAIQG